MVNHVCKVPFAMAKVIYSHDLGMRAWTSRKSHCSACSSLPSGSQRCMPGPQAKCMHPTLRSSKVSIHYGINAKSKCSSTQIPKCHHLSHLHSYGKTVNYIQPGAKFLSIYGPRNQVSFSQNAVIGQASVTKLSTFPLKTKKGRKTGVTNPQPILQSSWADFKF